LIVPTFYVGMPPVTLCVAIRDAERPERHSHAERGNERDTPVEDGNPGGVRAILIVPTFYVGMPSVTLCVAIRDAERPERHSHAERGNERDTPVEDGNPGGVRAISRGLSISDTPGREVEEEDSTPAGS
jgi:hypothetical protein